MTALDEWRLDAACLGSAPLWDATIDDGGRWTGEPAKARTARYNAAIAICETCPVAGPCYKGARIGVDEGVRGGVVLPLLTQATASFASENVKTRKRRAS